MKQNILGASPYTYRKKLIRQIAVSIAAAVFTLMVNFLLVALRTADNHNLFLVINILSDTVCGWFLLFFLATKFFPRYRLYRLTQRPSCKISAKVTSIHPETIRYMNLDCRKVTTDEQVIFLPDCAIVLKPNQVYTFGLVNNIIVEVVE